MNKIFVYMKSNRYENYHIVCKKLGIDKTFDITNNDGFIELLDYVSTLSNYHDLAVQFYY